MSGQFKISLFLLAGMAISLSACNTIDSSTQATPTAANSSPNSVSAPIVKKTTEKQGTQQASQTLPVAKNQGSDTAAERAKYKSVPLDKITNTKALIGTDPKAMAVSAFGEIESRSKDVQVEQSQLNKTVVTITQTGVADDSVGGIKYRVEFTPTTESAQTNKQWKIVWAGSQYKCQVGRGHQDWSTEYCQ